MDKPQDNKDWLNDETYQNLIKDLKTTMSVMRKTDINDPKMNILKIECSRVTEHPVWEYLNGVVGINYTIAAAMLSQIDILGIQYVSQIYSYCGIASRNKYQIDKPSYKVYLKKLLMTDLVNRFISMNSEYALYYYSHIIFLINRDIAMIKNGEMSENFLNESSDKLKPRHTLEHIKNMSKRYMIQKFLRDFYEASKNIMNVPTINGYVQNKGVIRGDDLYEWKQFVGVSPEKFKVRRIYTKQQIKLLNDKINDLIAVNGY